MAGGLRADARALLKTLALESCELSLMLVSDRQIRRLNREFRGKDLATDVLSFPQLEPTRELELSREAPAVEAPPMAIGDIVISIDTALRQARELNQRASARIRTLLIHGMLHLLGYDHERSMTEARRMFAREHELAALMASTGSRGACAPGRELPRTMPDQPPATKPRKTLWSPAAMPELTAKVTKKTAGRRASGVKTAPAPATGRNA